MSYHNNKDLHPTCNNPYKLNYGNIELFIEDLTRFMDDWSVAPTDIMDALEETHITACKIRWPDGDIPNHVSDYRIKRPQSVDEQHKQAYDAQERLDKFNKDNPVDRLQDLM
jgi:hypothetical protein